MSSTCRAIAAAIASFGCVASACADDLCKGNFPNLITDICWSCTFPIKMFGSTSLISNSQEDYDTVSEVACACTSPPKVGVPLSFWEMDMMTDVTSTPGCFPLLGGVRVDVGVNADAFGHSGSSDASGRDQGRESFRQVNLYINPAMYVTGAVLDDGCLDQRGVDVPWVSVADPTHNSSRGRACFRRRLAEQMGSGMRSFARWSRGDRVRRTGAGLPRAVTPHAEPGRVQRRHEDERQRGCHHQATHDRDGHRPPEHATRERDHRQHRGGGCQHHRT
jgi:hypothetical protein